ncbi:MAG: NAD(P)/FAD-dependent oxidoreductase [Oscillospiraceae bacterium]|nr:NAD(P)/FAD-dependent oxidoreductase [Oscillospiraceae bacterium]
MRKDYDVAVIGGGVIGCAVARELSRRKLRICLIEKGEDVCSGTSKANSGIVHAGFDAKPGTMKAKMNLLGSRMMPQLAQELDIRFKRNGSLVLCLSEDGLPALKELYQRGVENGVEGLAILTGDEAREKEPNLSDSVVAALYAPTGGIVCPFELTIALAENACVNGVEFRRNETVTGIARGEGGYVITTNLARIGAACVVNAAGVHADEIHRMVSAVPMHITPRKGDYCLMDKEVGGYVSCTVFQLPSALGKGVLVTPTAHGNLLIGPTATDVEDREQTSTTAAELSYLTKTAAQSVRDLPTRSVITSFSGLRAHEDGGDFIIGEAADAENFFEAAGIESPGLTSAPAIGSYLAGLIAEKLNAEERSDFIPTRKAIARLAELPVQERKALIAENPLYGSIVCRCEQISEGEIVEAIRRPVGAVSLDGIKRRVRAGMGRCQAGFCTPRLMEILARELHRPMEEICKNVSGSELLTGKLEGRK